MNDVKKSPPRGIQSCEDDEAADHPVEPTAELLAACEHGDRDAQRRIYERYQQPIYRLAYRLVGSQDAADLTQQIFLQLFQKMGQFIGRSRFRTWLYRLAVNECLQHLRRRKRQTNRRLTTEPVDSSPSEAARWEQHELLQHALSLLEPELRTIFLLKEIEHLSYAELADALEIPEGTVASRLNRARTQLKTSLIELGWEP